ncbi:hypothetical protein NDU88_001110 [Pleurodeles waltl]|uniref:Uncharacterized protein n=1 Tax=Pleurodeles waltl TaxID=8319 RepID=A0AAV7RBN2_PLEWA|nr:hypothetical protein NDU88_001110 [Pleurodeles waltl]
MGVHVRAGSETDLGSEPTTKVSARPNPRRGSGRAPGSAQGHAPPTAACGPCTSVTPTEAGPQIPLLKGKLKAAKETLKLRDDAPCPAADGGRCCREPRCMA